MSVDRFSLRRLGRWVVRNRARLWDLGLVALAFGFACLIVLEVGVFGSESRVSRARETLELNELMGLAAVLVGGALYYGWRRAREHIRENARRLSAEREVLALALQDPLTGLPNRRQFDEAMRRALAAMPGGPEAHAVLLLDLNGFKKINDVHGHPVGDEVLIRVGARLMRAVRDGDLVARLGGDEFVVLARNVMGAEGATTLALRIIEALAAPVEVSGSRHAVGAAIGVALSPQDGTTSEELLRKADVALYRAKAERRSASRFFEPAMDARLQERAELEQALRQDVGTDAFELLFRPVVALADTAVTAFEAHPRWVNPALGVLAPDRYLPVAEETGLLPDLTEQLLERACAAARHWPPPVRLAFSIPGALLDQPAFGLRIFKVLAASGLSPTRLEIEVDEGALIRDVDGAEALLAPLRRAGIAIVAANFGTGYADLKSLQRLQLDGIKIDRSFIEAMGHDRKAAVMVKALIGIGQGLEIAVTAEGVESPEQRAALSAQGCAQVQGPAQGALLDAEAAGRLFGVGPEAPRRRA